MPQTTMPRFAAMDGLRAWMAWMVVASHAPEIAGLMQYKKWHNIVSIGDWAVDTFIIISGFVISHLIIERREKYAPYILQRFMRLYPAFIVAFGFGVFTTVYLAKSGQDGKIQDFWWKILTHVAMLHGAIPNNIIPDGEYAFLPPAWSTSLEWQFYIVAPAILWCTRGRTRIFVLIVGAVILAAAYRHWWEPLWGKPSVVIGAAPFFLIGIISRMAIPSLAGRLPYPAATAVGVLAVAITFNVIAIGIWGCLIAFMLASSDIEGIDNLYMNACRLVLESKIVKLAADRSYSTYLLHWPVMLISAAIINHFINLHGVMLVCTLMIAATVFTVALQEGLYRLVERPAHAAGKRWAQSWGATQYREIPVETAVDAKLAIESA